MIKTIFFSYDVRHSQDGIIIPKHWSENTIFTERAFFNVPYLFIYNVTDSDSGKYKCKVDFKKSQTKFSYISLFVKGNILLYKKIARFYSK